jgi:phage baseplate assembly protein W
MANDDAFLGRGWSFPPTFDRKAQGVKMVSGEKDVQESLQILLSTKIGERVMQPAFGSNLDDLLFESITTTFLTLIQTQIERAIIFYEPRIRINKVNILIDDIQEGLILIELDYTIRTTNARNNLVYPYYLNEGTEVPG